MTDRARKLVNAMRDQIRADWWCKTPSERLLVNEQFTKALRKAGLGMPFGVKKMCLALGYLEKTGEGINAKYTLTETGAAYATQQEKSNDQFAKDLERFGDQI